MCTTPERILTCTVHVKDHAHEANYKPAPIQVLLTVTLYIIITVSSWWSKPLYETTMKKKGKWSSVRWLVLGQDLSYYVEIWKGTVKRRKKVVAF